jgi:hypothetical protein
MMRAMEKILSIIIRIRSLGDRDTPDDGAEGSGLSPG